MASPTTTVRRRQGTAIFPEATVTSEPEIPIGAPPPDPDDIAERMHIEREQNVLERRLAQAEADDANLYGVDPALWSTLTEAQRQQAKMRQPARYVPPSEQPIPVVTMDPADSNDAAQHQFEQMFRDRVPASERMAWTLLCDPAEYDERWGWVIKSVSLVPRGALEHYLKKVNRATGRSFTTMVPPDCRFIPDPTVRCDMLDATRAVCMYRGYPDAGDPNHSEDLEAHQRLVHPQQHAARRDQLDRDLRREELNLQRENAALMRRMLEQNIQPPTTEKAL